MDPDSQRRVDPDAALGRLATYGTLAPGRPNHHQLDGLDGRWFVCHVYGRLVDAGWGAGLGYPALVLDPGESAVEVQVFESVDLPAHWPRLDEFEGPGYQRVTTTVHTADGDVAASNSCTSSPSATGIRSCREHPDVRPPQRHQSAYR
jgi:gamma-glutamylcyclotransferase (GGCT)/AIG2-like uncharacterized protein YtfP